MTEKSATRFTVPVTVRFRDLDALGHVNHAVYFTYMEIARTEYWMHLMGDHRVAALNFIVAKASCDFLAPAEIGQRLEVDVRIPALRNSSFDFEYEIRDQASGRPIAKGLTVQVHYDYGARKSVPIPSELRARITAFEQAGAPPSTGATHE